MKDFVSEKRRKCLMAGLKSSLGFGHGRDVLTASFCIELYKLILFIQNRKGLSDGEKH